jgi:hypothetical protein
MNFTHDPERYSLVDSLSRFPDTGQRGQGATEPRLLYTSVEFSRKLTAMLPKHRKKNALRAEK